MKRHASLWGSISILTGVVVGITALVRGPHFIPMILLAFAVWGVWAVLTQCVPYWHTERIKREQQKRLEAFKRKLQRRMCRALMLPRRCCAM